LTLFIVTEKQLHLKYNFLNVVNLRVFIYFSWI